MGSRFLPSEHVFALLLYLAISFISALSLARLVPRFFLLDAKLALLNQQSLQAQASVDALNIRPLNHKRTLLNLSNHIQHNNIAVLWINSLDKDLEK